MPTKAARYCAKCNQFAVRRGLCERHAKERDLAESQRRDNRWLYLYHDQRWCGPHGLRAQQLAKEPLCRTCRELGFPWGIQAATATVADHIKPHKGNVALFFDPSNLQSQCKRHHDIKTLDEGAFGRPAKTRI